MKHIYQAVLFALVILVPVPTFAAQARQVGAVSAPSMTVMLEPYVSDGQLRQYSIPGGASYWTTDLPIYTNDKVKVDVFVATGANDLQRMKVRLDNQQLADTSQAPWATSFDASKLGPGYHFIEAWAQVSGFKATTPQFVTHTLTFFVAPQPVPAVEVSQPAVGVKGVQQILKGNTVVNVPLGPTSSSDSAPLEPSLPDVINGASLDSNAQVTLHIQDLSSHTELANTNGYQVSTPVMAVVSPVPGSGVHKFVYEIVSDGQPLVSDNTPYSTSYTRIRIQPRTSAAAGLLPGTVYVWVWGITDAGKYSRPAYAKVDISSSP